MTEPVPANKINVLIIGAGMYVCGRGTDGYGTILPAVMQAHKAGLIDRVLIASRRAESFIELDKKVTQLRDMLNSDMSYKQYPAKNDPDPNSYETALRDLPPASAVIIVTPDHLHMEMALAAIRHQQHVLVVKPLTPTVDETYQLIEASEKAGVYGAVEFHKRWDLANLKLREAIANGTIGEPLYFHIEYSQRKSIPTRAFKTWVRHTNVFQYLGVHYADIVYFVTRDHPIRLMAIGQSKWLKTREIDTYDSIQVIVEWSGGFVSTFLTNWIDPETSSAMSQQAIKVVGTKGRFESNHTNRGVRVVSDSAGAEEHNPYFCQSYYNPNTGRTEYRGYGIESTAQFLADVSALFTGERKPEDFEDWRPTFRDSIVATAVVEGVRLSLDHDSSWVYFDERLIPGTEVRS